MQERRTMEEEMGGAVLIVYSSKLSLVVTLVVESRVEEEGAAAGGVGEDTNVSAAADGVDLLSFPCVVALICLAFSSAVAFAPRISTCCFS